MILFAGVSLIAGWGIARLGRPEWFRSGPRAGRILTRLAAPLLFVMAVGQASPGAAFVLAVACLGVDRFAVHSQRILRREVLRQIVSIRSRGVDAPFPEVAAHLLLERFAAAGMQPAEAAVLAGRCLTPDDVAAQVALRAGGMEAYAAYLRRFGRTREVADADTAVYGDRFPGSGRGKSSSR